MICDDFVGCEKSRTRGSGADEGVRPTFQEKSTGDKIAGATDNI
jgi:hypothetical protein